MDIQRDSQPTITPQFSSTTKRLQPPPGFGTDLHVYVSRNMQEVEKESLHNIPSSSSSLSTQKPIESWKDPLLLEQ
jgi:hypothetical protein